MKYHSEIAILSSTSLPPRDSWKAEPSFCCSQHDLGRSSLLRASHAKMVCLSVNPPLAKKACRKQLHHECITIKTESQGCSDTLI